MRRLRVPWRWALFAGAFLFALAALLPLRLALAGLGVARKGLAAEEAVGSVWFGALGQARFGPVPLGDVTARLRFLPLLAGRARIDLRRDEKDGDLRMGLSFARNGVGIDDATGHVDVAALRSLPPVGLDLDDVSFRFRDGQCASAEGIVRARFAGEVAGVPIAAGFSGRARCDGRALLLPLATQAGTERIGLRFYAEGRWRADLSLRRAGVAIGTRLQGEF